MRDLFAFAAGTILAGVIGLLAERTRMRPVVQSAGAALAGGTVGCLLGSALAIDLIFRSGHLVAVSFALTPELVGGAIVLVALAVGGHWLLGLTGECARIPVARHRPLILALLAEVFHGLLLPIYPCPLAAI